MALSSFQLAYKKHPAPTALILLWQEAATAGGAGGAGESLEGARKAGGRGTTPRGGSEKEGGGGRGGGLSDEFYVAFRDCKRTINLFKVRVESLKPQLRPGPNGREKKARRRGKDPESFEIL